MQYFLQHLVNVSLIFATVSTKDYFNALTIARSFTQALLRLFNLAAVIIFCNSVGLIRPNTFQT